MIQAGTEMTCNGPSALATFEAVQAYGYLVALVPRTGAVCVASANIGELITTNLQFGRSTLSDLVTDPDVVLRDMGEIYARLERSKRRQAYNIRFLDHVIDSSFRLQCNCVAYASGELLVLEMEPARKYQPADRFESASRFHLKYAIPDLNRLGSVKEMVAEIARVVKQITGFDRVAVCRFDSNCNAEILGESKEAQLDSFLGLHFPSQLLPEPTRTLLRVNWIRMVADVDSRFIDLLPVAEQSGRKPLDMTQSVLRVPDELHKFHLRQLGVRACMTISLMRNDQLWGLIACYHYKPHYVPLNLRLNCEILGQLYSWQLGAKEDELASARRRSRLDLVDQMVDSFADKENLLENLALIGQPLLELMDASGFALISGSSVAQTGEVPEEDALRKLIAQMVASKSQAAVQSHCLAEDYPDQAHDSLELLAGALIVPVMSERNYYAAWFRNQQPQEVSWAGRDTRAVPCAHHEAPAPFNPWQAPGVQRAEPWTEDDIRIAERFNRLFVQHVVEKRIIAERRLQQLQALDQAKDHFLASVSHELRSPLNTIMGWAELALFKPDDHDKAIEALHVIKRAAKNQADLINDLLDLSRIISGNLKLNVQTVNMAELIEQACKSFDAASRAKGVHLTASADIWDGLVIGDPARINQILTNLLGNALKFTPCGGDITITGFSADGHYVVTVEDTGKGIAADSMPYIFDRFYQPDESHSKQGLGLGLSIVKSLVDMHNGDVRGRSDGEGKGACFTVRLPVAPFAPRTVDEEILAATCGGLADTEAACRRLAGLRILVAEDEPDARKFVTLTLRNHGGLVTSVHDGQQAWRRLNEVEQPFDLLLSDIGMPKLDGYSLIAKVRSCEDAQINGIRAVALTAFAYGSDRLRAIKEGFDEFVAKPVDSEELISVLERVSA